MEFWNYETMYEQAKIETPQLCKTIPWFYEAFGNSLKTNPSFQIGCRITEANWYLDSRPYFKVWPAIIDALLKTKLDIPFSILAGNDDQESVLAIRLPKEIDVLGMPEATASLVTWHPFNGGDLGFMLCAQRKNGVFSSMHIPRAPSDCSIETLEMEFIHEGNVDQDSVKSRLGFLRLAIAIRLLQKDPDFFKPDVLAADRNEFDRTTDPEKRQRMIDRARRKGIVGWRVGEQYENIPHFRRPHFALRHTGTGGIIPRIVPIKGSVVHRQKLTSVPTGHLDGAGNEVEE